VTNNEEIAKKVRTLRNYGAPQKYFHSELGTNSRLDTLQAAILQVKLPHLFAWNEARNKAAFYYDRALEQLQNRGIIPIENQSDRGHVYHLYVIRIDDSCSLNRDEIQDKLAEKGIQTGIHYPIPCHLQPAYKFLGYRPGDLPQAELLCKQILSLPMYPGLSDIQIDRVVDTLKSIL
jgi:dTDP-4-amino-4,6-dideoxygalactose transaminase